MKLIVGLGNPGSEYENTRHNIGFFMLDKYVEKNNIGNWHNKFNSMYIDSIINGEKVFFIKPQTFINLSGDAVRKFMDFYKISCDDILIISDDLDLKIGNFKLKDKGSSGGHNGLKSIEQNLGTNEYKRIKIGISNNKDVDTKDYVLGKLSKNEFDNYCSLFNEINDIINDFFDLDFRNLMNKYNKKNR